MSTLANIHTRRKTLHCIHRDGYNAILKLIEQRFKLAPLTKRDAAQKSMTEFFNFNAPPWMTPPTPPAQTTSGACYLNKLP